MPPLRRPHPDQPAPRRGTAQNLEVLVGMLGALSFLLLATTIWAEVTGRPAGVLALLLLLLVVATWASWRAWRSVLRRPPPRR